MLELMPGKVVMSFSSNPFLVPSFPEVTIQKMKDCISRRRAEVILHQLICGSFPGVWTFYPPDVYDHGTTCHMCSLSIPETVEHALLRCTGISSLRKKLFGFLQRKDWTIPFICWNYSINTLKFVDNEGLIKSP